MNTSAYRTSIVAVLTVLFLAFSSPAEARGSRHHRRGRSNRGARGSSQSYAMMRAAAIRAAQAEVSRAHSAMRNTRTRLDRGFSLSASLEAAERNEAEAHQAYEESLRVVLDRLNKSPQYLDALAASQRLDDQLRTARDTGRATPEQITALAKEKAQVGAVATRLRVEAVEGDASARDTRDRLAKANDELNSLKRSYDSSILSNPEWNSARKSLEQARVKLATAYSAGNRALTQNKNSRPQRKQRTP